MEKANKVSRQALLAYKSTIKPERIPFTTNFHPTIRDLFQSFRSLWGILQSDVELGDVFKTAPLLSFRQPPNLKKLLVRSQLPRATTPTGNLPCHKPRCQICKHVCTSYPMKPPGTTLNLYPGNFNCDSENVVYILFCMKCTEGNYVGETKTKFRLRFNNHKHTITQRLAGFSVAEHFSSPGHTIQDLKLCIWKGHFRNDAQRKAEETRLILRINSHRKGLNRDLGLLNEFF